MSKKTIQIHSRFTNVLRFRADALPNQKGNLREGGYPNSPLWAETVRGFVARPGHSSNIKGASEKAPSTYVQTGLLAPQPVNCGGALVVYGELDTHTWSRRRQRLLKLPTPRKPAPRTHHAVTEDRSKKHAPRELLAAETYLGCGRRLHVLGRCC